MTGNVQELNSNPARGALVIIFPIALVIVVIIHTWRWIVLFTGLMIGWKLWQNYQWQKLTTAVNPFFKQLIKENQGCLTALDLSLKTNMTAKTARRFLEGKAEEYGAQRQVYEDKRSIVYYFLTASALGSIFDDSDPILEPEAASPKLAAQPSSVEPSLQEIPQVLELEDSESDSPLVLKESQEKLEPSLVVGELVELDDEEPNQSNKEMRVQAKSISPLIQTELAKRLNLHASTVAKHKSLPDFPQWSQSQDPEGVSWKYLPETKMFVPVTNQ
ncbi:MAG: hypothetical protein GDA44_14205 [Prochloron sp. SP5CPC1]|nr:hypothetical protein [Candidatus Paraprochloron terpiosi SP5CPC1]